METNLFEICMTKARHSDNGIQAPSGVCVFICRIVIVSLSSLYVIYNFIVGYLKFVEKSNGDEKLEN